MTLPLSAAPSIRSQIYDIDIAKSPQEDTLIFLTNGTVAKTQPEKSEILSILKDAKNKSVTYDFKLDKNRFILEVTPSSAQEELTSFPLLDLEGPETYLPTTIASMDVAKKYFKEARYNPKDSQCFNRAMVWTYEWWRNHSLRSNKILIYFSRTYIRRYNFEWWFHIAPYVHVKDQGKVVERVMDVKYGRGPLEFRKWTNLFVNKDPECPVITKFSDYADYPYSGECFIQRTNMYTYQPADLQMNEAWNYTKDKFIMKEVKQAYLEAFDETI
jgi:hypothetical protein